MIAEGTMIKSKHNHHPDGDHFRMRMPTAHTRGDIKGEQINAIMDFARGLVPDHDSPDHVMTLLALTLALIGYQNRVPATSLHEGLQRAMQKVAREVKMPEQPQTRQ